MAMPAEEGD